MSLTLHICTRPARHRREPDAIVDIVRWTKEAWSSHYALQVFREDRTTEQARLVCLLCMRCSPPSLSGACLCVAVTSVRGGLEPNRPRGACVRACVRGFTFFSHNCRHTGLKETHKIARLLNMLLNASRNEVASSHGAVAEMLGGPSTSLYATARQRLDAANSKQACPYRVAAPGGNKRSENRDAIGASLRMLAGAARASASVSEPIRPLTQCCWAQRATPSKGTAPIIPCGTKTLHRRT